MISSNPSASASLSASVVARPRTRREVGEGAWALLFLTPYLLGLVLLIAGPVLAVLALSFTRWDIVSDPRFIGLDNYAELVSDPLFWKSLGNTIYYIAAVVPAEIVLALLLALLLNRKLRFVAFFRAAVFMPFVVSLASAALVWTWLYSPDFGLINFVLRVLHIPGPQWLADPAWAMPAIILMSIWRNTGYYMVIFLAGLQTVPRELYEAADLDGAGRWAKTRHITLPVISPTIFFVLVIAVIWSFQVFDPAFIMTQGGPYDATTTLVYYIYTTGFKWFRMGYGSALAYVLLTLILLITLLQFWGQKRWVHYEQ